MPTVAKHNILIQATTGGLEVTALRGEGIPKITDGMATWTTVNRPRKVGLTQYTGRNPFQMSLPILLDGWVDGESQEGNIRQLIWMALPDENLKRPKTVRLYGALPFPSSGEWVIQNPIEFGDNVIWKQHDKDSNPVRLRQDITLTLLEYVEADKIELLVKNTGLAPKTPGRILVKPGINLRNLAAKYYGNFKLWFLIADANGLRDPKITKKQWIVIPPLN